MKRIIAIAKIILVIALVLGYFFLVPYEEFHREKRKVPVQKKYTSYIVLVFAHH